MARWLLALVMSCVLLCADVRPAAAQHVRTSPLASLPQLYADSVPSSGKTKLLLPHWKNWPSNLRCHWRGCMRCMPSKGSRH